MLWKNTYFTSCFHILVELSEWVAHFFRKKENLGIWQKYSGRGPFVFCIIDMMLASTFFEACWLLAAGCWLLAASSAAWIMLHPTDSCQLNKAMEATEYCVCFYIDKRILRARAIIKEALFDQRRFYQCEIHVNQKILSFRWMILIDVIMSSGCWCEKISHITPPGGTLSPDRKLRTRKGYSFFFF